MTLNIMTLSIMTLGIMTLSIMTLSIMNYFQELYIWIYIATHESELSHSGFFHLGIVHGTINYRTEKVCCTEPPFQNVIINVR
jgi:hypothetical protein